MNELRRRVRGPLSRLAEGLKAGTTARTYVEALYGFMEELHLEAALTERMHRQADAGRMQEAEETPPSCGKSSAACWISLWRFWGRSI